MSFSLTLLCDNIFYCATQVNKQTDIGGVMAKIAMIGAGVVGQASGKGFVVSGHEVVFCDVRNDVVEKLRVQGFTACVPEHLHEEGGDFDAFLLSVCTPTRDKRICFDYLEVAISNLAVSALAQNQKYCIVVPRSTIPPGTTQQLLIPLLEKYSGKKAGRDFGVCFNPEFLRERCAENDFLHPWIVVIGELDAISGRKLEEIYNWVGCPIEHTTIAEAEAEKYVHNVFNAVKITYFNEMREALKASGIDADRVFRIVAQSCEGCFNPFYGTKNFGPFDGSCLPKDTQAFLGWAEESLRMDLPLLRTAIEVNNRFAERALVQAKEKLSAVQLTVDNVPVAELSLADR